MSYSRTVRRVEVVDPFVYTDAEMLDAPPYNKAAPPADSLVTVRRAACYLLSEKRRSTAMLWAHTYIHTIVTRIPHFGSPLFPVFRDFLSDAVSIAHSRGLVSVMLKLTVFCCFWRGIFISRRQAGGNRRGIFRSPAKENACSRRQKEDSRRRRERNLSLMADSFVRKRPSAPPAGSAIFWHR